MGPFSSNVLLRFSKAKALQPSILPTARRSFPLMEVVVHSVGFASRALLHFGMCLKLELLVTTYLSRIEHRFESRRRVGAKYHLIQHCRLGGKVVSTSQ